MKEPPDDPEGDRELLKRACRGEHAAWNVLYQRFASRFLGLAGRLILKHGPRVGLEARRSHVEDFVQSIWQHMLKRCPEIDHGFDPALGTLDTYLTTIARHVVLSQLRSPGRRPWSPGDDLDSAPEAAATETDPETRADDRQVLASLKDCMERELKSEELQLLTRVLIDDEDIETIARERKMQRNTLDKQISRARQRLRDCMLEINISRRSPRK